MTNEQLQRVAGLLEDVASGVISAAEALGRTEKWDDILWQDSLFSDAYHALQHYESDEDIRVKDAEYASEQVATLRRLSERLLKAQFR